MFSIDDKEWIKDYLLGEVSWVNMELFRYGGKIWTNHSIDDILNENKSNRALFVFDPVLYASKRMRPNIDLLDSSCPLILKYRDKFANPSMDLLLQLWDFVFSHDALKDVSVIGPENPVPPTTSFNFIKKWLECHQDRVDQFLKELKSIIGN